MQSIKSQEQNISATLKQLYSRWNDAENDNAMHDWLVVVWCDTAEICRVVSRTQQRDTTQHKLSSVWWTISTSHMVQIT